MEGKRIKQLPPIREGKDVKDDEPRIICGNKTAALPPPIKVEDGA